MADEIREAEVRPLGLRVPGVRRAGFRPSSEALDKYLQEDGVFSFLLEDGVSYLLLE